MRLLSVRVFEGQQHLEAFVQDDNGKLFRVPYHWFTQYETECPPDSWIRTVKAEVVRLRERPNTSLQALYRILGTPK